ncbi:MULTISPECIES: quinolinate synthase NadA [Microbacterium]|uniref:quinolinate synthase NadA n=1 Tax=Microbacterium TaxID=33882 RepID=UPI0007687DC0|nr:MULTISPECIES: quinolinate synthase NadA [Microbacterium]KXC05455.1 quinolinate synthetase [Microbacterium hominis]QOC25192.1 quinolinate synthase NadA [Microbacterium hominis]QOC29224.1 quinolinate synthase NadA [Microbacterium hominis]QYF98579.1 quinolinate synthase NadA [Microbacterium sp. PAMC21962]
MSATILTLTPPPADAVDPSVDHGIQAIVAGASTAETCNTELAAGPWDFDRRPGYGPGSSMGDVIPVGSPRQGELPAEYRTAGEDELHARIRAAKQTLGSRVVVLGHFYQREEVVTHADYVGDSFQLANAALEHPDAEAIVFCGVHFMAETADLLSRPEQAVILPNLAAGCSMADMASIDEVEECWEQLADVYGDLEAPDADGRVPVIPVTYMNSSAAIKGFVGRHGGIVCTSSNARTVLEWAFARGRRVLFFPDQHLGRNTAKAMGVPIAQMPMWNPRKPLGGSTPAELADARVILWHGFCSVHRRFTVDQIDKARAEHPGVRVIVHPECPMAVVDAADEAGSTDYIRKAIAAATEPTTFAIGTEINLVQRLAAQYPQHRIFCLDPVVCPCSTMYRIHPGYLAWVLERLVAGEVVNRITVPADVADPARVALERMLAAKP